MICTLTTVMGLHNVSTAIKLGTKLIILKLAPYATINFEKNNMIINPMELDNLFSANYRIDQIVNNKFTDAEFVSVDDLLFEATMEAEYADK